MGVSAGDFGRGARNGRTQQGEAPLRARRRGPGALAMAWLALLVLVAAAFAYAFLTYRAPEPEATLTPLTRFEEAPAEAPQPLPSPGGAPEQATQSPPSARPSVAEDRQVPPVREEPAEQEALLQEDALPEESGQVSPEEDLPATGTGQAPPEQQAALPRVQPVPPAAPVEPAWQRFAMPYAGAPNLPRIAVVVTGLGLHDDLTQQAIDELPPGVTLSFSPYARGLETWLAQARARGHEVMLDLPMEPESYPNSDPGHFGLFVSHGTEQNLDRLRQVLARGSAYVGLAGVMGSRFTSEPEVLRPVLTALGDRGLMYLDNRESDAGIAAELGRQLGLPTLYSDRTLDGEFVHASAIDSRLAQVERLARTKGVAVAMANVYPTTFQQISAWAAGLGEKGLALAPITALLGRQPPPA